MIFPTGKRKQQVAQAGPKDNTLWDSEWFKKYAEQIRTAIAVGTQEPGPTTDPGLSDAMSRGSAAPGISGQMQGDGLDNPEDAMPSSLGAQPNGEARPTGVAGDMNQRGLRASPIEEDMQQQSTIQAAIPQLSQYLEGKSLELKANPVDKEGVLEFVVGANQMSQLPPSVNLQNTNEEAADMARILGGSVPPNNLSWYDSKTGVAHIYIQMGSPNPGPVVQKRKGRR